MKNRSKYRVMVLMVLALILSGCGSTKGPSLSSQEQEIVNEAVSHLINPEGSIAEDKDDASFLVKAMEEFESIELHEFNAEQTALLQFTSKRIGEEVLRAFKAGYEIDLGLTEWYATFNDSNVEFVMIMRLEGSESIAFRGNFFREKEQFNFERMYGDIDMNSLIG